MEVESFRFRVHGNHIENGAFRKDGAMLIT